MKAKVLLIGSLLLNLGLGIYALRKPAAGTAHDGTGAATASVRPNPVGAEKLKPETGPTIATNNAVRQFNWEAVESPDYKQYIANLRAIGCPDETIRDIILADVTKLYEEKKKAVRGSPKKFEYWKPTSLGFFGAGNAESLQKARALDEEKNNILRALGIEPDFKTQVAEMTNPLEAMFDFLPEAKRGQLLKVMSDLQTKMAKAVEGGGQDPEIMARILKEMERDVKRMLTPEEALAFDLRMSMTANMMRNQLAGFDPTEEEFLKVFKLRKPFDEEFSPMTQGNETEQEHKRRQDADKQLKDQIKEALGPDRYAAYERAQDWTYQQMHRAAKSANLGTSEADQIYEMKKLAEDQARLLRIDRNLSPEQRSDALFEIRKETERSIQGVLGEKGWQQYNRPMNMHWLDAIKHSPPAASQSLPVPENR